MKIFDTTCPECGELFFSDISHGEKKKFTIRCPRCNVRLHVTTFLNGKVKVRKSREQYEGCDRVAE